MKIKESAMTASPLYSYDAVNIKLLKPQQSTCAVMTIQALRASLSLQNKPLNFSKIVAKPLYAKKVI